MTGSVLCDTTLCTLGKHYNIKTDFNTAYELSKLTFILACYYKNNGVYFLFGS